MIKGIFENFVRIFSLAGVEGIEPPSTVLETVVVPFNYTPMVIWTWQSDSPNPCLLYQQSLL